MSAINDVLYDFMEDTGITDFPLDEKNLVKFNTRYLVKTIRTVTLEPLAEEFFKSVLPVHDGLQYWLILLSNGNSVSNSYTSIEEFLKAYALYSATAMDAFYTPCIYDGWRTAGNARYTKVVFVDIDGLDSIDLINMDNEEIKDWLCESYNIPDELLPNWCVCSGHGIHLYYIIEEIDFTDVAQLHTYENYIKSLICYFKGDMICKNRNHILRLPYSQNCKEEIITTKLHKLNDSTDYDISRLDYFNCTDDEILKYKDYLSAKRKTNNKPRRVSTKTVKSNINRKHEIKYEHCVPVESLNYFSDFNSHSRYWNIIKDLHNYYVRHNGDIYGMRNEFIHILACFLRIVQMSLDEAEDYIEVYCTVDFLDEAIITVEKIYNREIKKLYHYSNESIAELLNFTEDDYIKSYCAYREKERLEKRQRACKRAKDKQLAKRRAKNNKTKNGIRLYVSENMNMPSSELAILCGVSVRTIQRIKKAIQKKE